MKSRWTLTTIVLVAASLSAFAQQKPYATLSPDQPKVGDALTITYDASVSGAQLTDTKTMTAEVLFVKAEAVPQLVEVPMTKNGMRWSGSTTLRDSVILVQMRFVSGGKIDDRGENVWTNLVVDGTGTPVRGASMAWANTLMYGSVPGFKVGKDPEASLASASSEVKRSPNDWKIASSYWSLLMRIKPTEETKTAVEKEFLRLWDANTSGEEATAGLLPWFERLGRKAEGDSVKTQLIGANPRGKAAERVRQSEVYQERNAVVRADLFAAFLKDFPPKADAADAMQTQLTAMTLTAGKYGEGLRLAGQMKKPDSYVAMILNDGAWTLAEKGSKLDTAAILAERSVAMTRATLSSGKPSYMSRLDWEKSQKANLGMVLDTYGYALSKTNRSKEAQKAYAEAVELTGGKEAEINERYVECLNANGEFKTALEVCSKSVRANIASDKLLGFYRTAYAKVKGTEQGFEKLVGEEKAGAKKAEEQNLVEGMMNKPAVKFALKDLDGKTVSLDGLKGKVVVVDFWATWCGPCKSSFPFLQQVYEKYKSNPAVMILALNTWENKTGKEREDLVKTFMADNKYTFPVLYDEGIVEKYGVEGIPTKFVIDKQGNIRFKSVGFENGPKMVSELTSQIDILVADKAPKK